jgi:hypothetical protein
MRNERWSKAIKFAALTTVGLTIAVGLSLGAVSVLRGLGWGRLLYTIALAILIGLGWLTVSIRQDRRS